MDPVQALNDLRALAAEALAADTSPEALFDMAESLAEKFEALDKWLTSGGFLPRDWQPSQPIDRKAQTDRDWERIKAQKAEADNQADGNSNFDRFGMPILKNSSPEDMKLLGYGPPERD